MPHLSEDSQNEFLRGTYFVLAVHWATIAAFSWIPLVLHDFRTALQDKLEIFGVMGVYLVVIVSITACFGLHRKSPWNLGVLAVFTMAWILIVSMITAASQSYYLIFVLVTLTVVALFISAVSLVEHWNALGWTSILLIMLSVLLSHIVLLRYSKESPEVVSASLGTCLILLLYLLSDTVSIMSRSTLKLESDEYVFGALTLYLDVVIRFSEWINSKCCKCLQ